MRGHARRANLQSWLPQAVTLALLAMVVAWLVGNTISNLASRGITIGFDFLGRVARFPISESVVSYAPTDSFAWAFAVGLANTLFLSAIVIVASTLLGFFLGLARRSGNPMASGLATAYVDATRNTPLVVQLLFWYAAVSYGLPHSASALNPLPGVFLTDRGLYVPRPVFGGQDILFLCVAVVVLAAASIAFRRRMSRPVIVAASLGLLVLGWWLTGMQLSLDHPALGRFNFMGGMTLTPEFVAVVLGLTLYSTAFTAEIIRGGIDAVPSGQWEAARALALPEKDLMRRIVLPQALRIIIPPMASQYINIVKNSTLGLVVGFPELNFVTATTINQTGQAIEGIVVLMAMFLTLSIGTSLLLDRYNRRVALVER